MVVKLNKMIRITNENLNNPNEMIKIEILSHSFKTEFVGFMNLSEFTKAITSDRYCAISVEEEIND